MMNGPSTPPLRQAQQMRGGGCDGRRTGLQMGYGGLPTPAASPQHNIDSNNTNNNNSNNDDAATTSFVHACTSHLQQLASGISALLRTLSTANSAARQTCQRLHFEAVELLKAVLRAEQAGTLGKVLVTRGGGVSPMMQQAVLGLRVVWALERWREFERGVGEREREGGGGETV